LGLRRLLEGTRTARQMKTAKGKKRRTPREHGWEDRLGVGKNGGPVEQVAAMRGTGGRV